PAGVAALYDDYLRAFPSSRVGDARIGGGGRVPPPDAAPPGPPAFAPPPSAPAFAPPPSAPAGRAGPLPGPAPAPQFKTRVAAPPAAQAMRARVAPPEPEAAAALLMGAVGGDLLRSTLSPGDRVMMAPPPPPPPPPRLDYTNLRMAPPGSPERGALIP